MNIQEQVILVVDDDPDTRSIMKKVLDHEGYTVLVAVNAMEAITMNHNHAVDLVLLDLKLPGMHGFDACSAMKNDGNLAARPLVVFMSAMAPVKKEDKEKLTKGDGFLLKPFSLSKLINIVSRILANRD